MNTKITVIKNSFYFFVLKFNENFKYALYINKINIYD